MRILTGPIPLTLALVVPGCALAWILAVPDTLTPLSYSLFAGLLTALAAVALITYKHAQATGSGAGLLHENHIARSPRGARGAAD